MDEHRNDWVRLVDESAAWSSIAVELSAVSADELPGLLAYLDGAPRLPFLFISVHAPSKGFVEDEARLVEALSRVPAWVDTIVVHPDTISDPRLYRRLGRRLAIENMGTRKQAGDTAEDVEAVFAELPDARRRRRPPAAVREPPVARPSQLARRCSASHHPDRRGPAGVPSATRSLPSRAVDTRGACSLVDDRWVAFEVIYGEQRWRA
jgi:hypothetical protein